MSEFDAGERETTGYFLPEESRRRLKKLREYVAFLARQAQPRRPDEAPEFLPGVRVGEVAICLELLEEQVARVLGELSWPAKRASVEPVADAAPSVAPDAEGAAAVPPAGRYLFGVTLEQVDTLDRLINMIVALGDVVIASDEAEFADHTLAVLGDAIFNDARAVRAIIREVTSQWLDPARGPQTGVGEERAIYRAVEAGFARDRAPRRAGLAAASWRVGGGWPWFRQMPGVGFRQGREAVLAYH